MRGYLQRLRARRCCHGSIWCCQYVDSPQCNGLRCPHPLGRTHYQLRQRWETWKAERG